MKEHEGRDPAPDPELNEAVREAVGADSPDDVEADAGRAAGGEPPFDEVDWDALRARVADRAASTLARRRTEAGASPPVDARPTRPAIAMTPRSALHDGRRIASRGAWITAASIAAAAAAAVVVLLVVLGRGPLPVGPAAERPEPAAGEFVTLEDALFGGLSDDELRSRVTGRADPAAWLGAAVADDEG